MNHTAPHQLAPRVTTLEETVNLIQQTVNEHSSDLSIIKQTLRELTVRLDVMESTMERGFERMDAGFAELRAMIGRVLGE